MLIHWTIICGALVMCGLFFAILPFFIETHVSSSLHNCMSQAIFNTMNKTTFDECDKTPKLWVYLFELHILPLIFLSLSSIIALLKCRSK